MPEINYPLREETKVYLNFDGTHKFVNRKDVHTDEVCLILLASLLSGIKTNRAYINKNRLITRESAVILFVDFEATISTNGFTQKQCVNNIESLINELKMKGEEKEFIEEFSEINKEAFDKLSEHEKDLPGLNPLD